jgi:hypothetical protein
MCHAATQLLTLSKPEADLLAGRFKKRKVRFCFSSQVG